MSISSIKVGDTVEFPDSVYWCVKPQFKVMEIEQDSYPRYKIRCVKPGYRMWLGDDREDFLLTDAPFYVWRESLVLV